MNVNTLNVVNKIKIPMKLSDLAFTSHVYNYFTNYSTAYYEFTAQTEFAVDLSSTEHREAMIKWLNQWGCRNLACEYHTAASVELLKWYERNNLQLVNEKTMLWDYRKWT
jgi:hypothetical protein